MKETMLIVTCLPTNARRIFNVICLFDFQATKNISMRVKVCEKEGKDLNHVHVRKEEKMCDDFPRNNITNISEFFV